VRRFERTTTTEIADELLHGARAVVFSKLFPDDVVARACQEIRGHPSFPVGLDASFPMNAQATIILDPFTEESGATAYVPGSQCVLRYPQEDDRFYERCERGCSAIPADTVVFFGAPGTAPCPTNRPMIGAAS